MSEIFYFYNFHDYNYFKTRVKNYNVMTWYDTKLKYSCILTPKRITIIGSIFGRNEYIPKVNTPWNTFMKARRLLSENLDGSKWDKKIKKIIDEIDKVAIEIENR